MANSNIKSFGNVCLPDFDGEFVVIGKVSSGKETWRRPFFIHV
jgi:hypothetical protein